MTLGGVIRRGLIAVVAAIAAHVALAAGVGGTLTPQIGGGLGYGFDGGISSPASSSSSIIPAQGWGTANRLRGAYPFAPSGTYTNNISGWETWLGGTTDFVLAYATGPDWTTLLANVDAQITSLAPSNRVIHWSIGIPANKTLSDVVAGTEDANLLSVANKIKAARPSDTFYVIRPIWEAQNASIGSWYAVGQEATYITAFRRITQLFLGNSLKFRIDWTQNETTSILGTPYDPTQLYPGDQYVDLIGQDFYWGNSFSGIDPNAAWRLKQSDTYGLNFIAAFARAHNKPLAFGEWGLNYDAPQYVSLALEYFALNNVALEGYFNADNGGQFNNRLDLDQYPQVSARFKAEFASATALNPVNANTNAFTTAPWSGVANGIGAITGGQPDPLGGLTASTHLETAATSNHLNQIAPPLTVSSTPGIFRVIGFAKPKNGRNFVQHNIGMSTFAQGAVAYYDLVGQTPSATTFPYGGLAGFNVVGIPEANGFTKTATEFTSNGATDLQPQVMTASADNTNSFLGDVTKGLDLFTFAARRVGNAYVSPLPDCTGVFATYSLRRVIQSYTGPAVQITRASDNATRDFTPGQDGLVSMSQINTFISGTTGNVSTWYDQCSPGNRHITQGTSANRPVPTANQYGTKPGLVFSSVQQLTRASVPWTAADMQVYAVAKTGTGTTVYRTLFALGNAATAGVTVQESAGGTSQDWLQTDAVIAGAGTNSGLSPRAIVQTPGLNDGANHQIDFTLAAGGNDFFKDGASQTLRATSAAQVPSVTGTLSVSFSGASITGSIAELIIMNTTYAGRTTLRANQKAFWGTP